MRRSFILRVLPLALALLMPGSRAEGQGLVSLGVAGGLSMPFGDLGDVANPGWRALGTLAIGVPLVPIGVRLDAAYDRFGLDATLPGAAGSATGARQLFSGTANITFSLPVMVPLLTPYAIAGLGPYHASCTGDAQCNGVTRVGYNGGVGIRFGALRIHGFAEMRYHYVPLPGGSEQYVPVTVGLLF